MEIRGIESFLIIEKIVYRLAISESGRPVWDICAAFLRNARGTPAR